MKETGYLLQAALICAWWVGLTTSQVFFDAFQFDQIPPVAFWSFPVLIAMCGTRWRLLVSGKALLSLAPINLCRFSCMPSSVE
jgi:hypothetical protein